MRGFPALSARCSMTKAVRRSTTSMAAG
jgi:hypothetical protein